MRFYYTIPLALLLTIVFNIHKGTAHEAKVIKNHAALDNRPFINESPAADIQPLDFAAASIIPWTYENIYSNVWDTSPYKAYKYSTIEFRLMFPNGYDSTANDGKKYPLILHIAGRGEAGDDNELQLRHAGRGHKQAIESGVFPGYALFPQVNRENGFFNDADLKKIVEIIQLLIRDNKVDPNRIHVHGLSAGGESTWRLIRDYPHIFATALPMSWFHRKFVESDATIKKYIHIPIWNSQGGKDDFPKAVDTNEYIKLVRKKGGNIRYKYLPKFGHGTWSAMYNDPGFFDFMLQYTKLSIHVYYGQTSFCPGQPIDVTMGISLGFDEYEWQKDGQPLVAGPAQNEIRVTETGSYRVRFRRGTEWTQWSEPVVIDNNRDVLPTLEVSTEGKTRNLVTALDGSTSVTLTVPEGYEKYTWMKNGVAVPGTPSNSLAVNQAGSYTVSVSDLPPTGLDPNGIPTEFRPEAPRCSSPFSAPVVVTIQDDAGKPVPPANFMVDPKTPFSLQIRWDDVATDELGYEIYRATKSGGPYKLVTITPPNTDAFTDVKLKDNTTYFYQARAVNTFGGSDYTPETSATTGEDVNPPDAPVDITGTPVSDTQLQLDWTDEAFNEEGYKIYRSLSEGGPFDLVHTTTVDIDSFIDTGLAGHTAYFYQVFAFNKNGESAKISSPAITTLNGNPVIAPLASQTAITGETLTVTATATDPENDPVLLSLNNALNFVSAKDNGAGTSTITIVPSSSQTGFYGNLYLTVTDDRGGSSTSPLLLTVVNKQFKETVFVNLGSDKSASAPWNNTATSPVTDNTFKALVNASTGQPSAIQMKVLAGWSPDAEVTGATTPDNEGVFPDSVLATGWQTADSAAIEMSGLNPNLLYNFTFLASQASFNNGETAFYINGQKVVLNASKNVDNTVSLNGIIPNAEGKIIISITNSGASANGYLNALVVESYENTVPIQPADLQATPVSSTQIKLQWKDQAGNEEGYEIHRATGSDGEFGLLTTTAANVNIFTDGELAANTVYRYQVRAINNLGSSDFSNEVSANTLSQRILVNFNGSAHAMAPAPWNNTARTPSEGAIIPDLKDDTGAVTDVNLVIENWGTGFDNKLGLTTGDDSGVYPDEVLQTYYFLEPYDEPVRFVFTNLDPKLAYNFTFFGDGGSGEVSDGLFMPGSDLRTLFIIGQDTVVLNALDNTSKTVQIKNVRPNEENAIEISIMAYEGETVEASAIFGIFNSIVLEGFFANETVTNHAPVIASVEDQSFMEGESVSLQLQASDADGNTIAFSAINLPPGLSIDPATGLISGVIDQGAIANSPYVVEVIANDNLPANNLGKVTFNIEVTELQIVCTTPTGLSAETKIIGEAAAAQLKWTGEATAPGFVVRYRVKATTAWEEAQTAKGITELTLKNLAFDTEYEWNVQSLCEGSTFSDTSATQAFKTPLQSGSGCGTPQSLNVEVTSSEGAPNTAIVNWNPVSGIMNYQIIYSADSINWAVIISTKTSVTLTKLLENTDYHVLVKSVCKDDGSIISDDAYISFNSGTWAPVVCRTPENISYAFISGGSETNAAVITWNAVPFTLNYEIEYSTDSANWTLLSSNENSVTLTGLAENTKYYVRVHSVCGVDNISDFGHLTFSTGTFTEVCEIPVSLTVVEQTPKDTTVDVTLSWKGPENAAFFYVVYTIKDAEKWEKVKVENDTVLLSNLLPQTTYQWAVISGCSADETLISETSAIAEFVTDSVDVVSGIEEELEKLSFNVYPVPSQGTFTVEFKPAYTERVQMMVYNVLGALMYQTDEKTSEFIKEVSLNSPNPGVYFVKLIVGDRVYSKRILIQRQ